MKTKATLTTSKLHDHIMTTYLLRHASVTELPISVYNRKPGSDQALLMSTAMRVPHFMELDVKEPRPGLEPDEIAREAVEEAVVTLWCENPFDFAELSLREQLASIAEYREEPPRWMVLPFPVSVNLALGIITVSFQDRIPGTMDGRRLFKFLWTPKYENPATMGPKIIESGGDAAESILMTVWKTNLLRYEFDSRELMKNMHRANPDRSFPAFTYQIDGKKWSVTFPDGHRVGGGEQCLKSDS